MRFWSGILNQAVRRKKMHTLKKVKPQLRKANRQENIRKPLIILKKQLRKMKNWKAQRPGGLEED